MTAHFRIACRACGTPSTRLAATRCAACGGTLGFSYDQPASWPSQPGRVWDYAALLPLPEGVAPVTLGEGGTPLLPAARDRGARVWWKNEGANPTGSQKDRAISLAMTMPAPSARGASPSPRREASASPAPPTARAPACPA